MIVTLLGLVISLFAYLLAFPQPYQRRFDVYAALLAVHVLAAIFYWLLTFESGMDAYLYYRDPLGFQDKSALTSGTHFIVHVDQMIRDTIGGSFLDHFLFFQCFGMVGLALLIRSFNEIGEDLGMVVPLPVYALLFLPGLHFWSVSIGKDGPMFLAICLALWATLRIHKRIPWAVLALVIMALIRPHVAAIAMMALAGALLFSSYLTTRMRIILAPLALAGLVILVGQASEQFGVDLNPESFTDFVEQQQEHGKQYGSGAELQALPLPLKIWSLLFRPFFIDGEGMMHWAASFENAALLAIFGYIAIHLRLLFSLARKVFFVAYSVLFSSVVILLLSLVNYNIGLGQRQKMMAIPAILLIAVSIYLYKRYLRASQNQAIAEIRPEPLPEATVAET